MNDQKTSVDELSADEQRSILLTEAEVERDALQLAVDSIDPVDPPRARVKAQLAAELAGVQRRVSALREGGVGFVVGVSEVDGETVVSG